MLSDVYGWMEFKLSMMIDTIVLYILILFISILTLIQGHRNVKKWKTSAPIISQITFAVVLL